MLDTSSIGRAQHKTRTINVEANLMAQRISERARLQENIYRRTVMCIVTLAATGIIVPPLFRWQGNQAMLSAMAAARQTEAAALLQAVQQEKASTEPKLAEETIRGNVVKYAQGYIGEVIRFTNASRPDMTLAAMKVDIAGGEVKIVARADAESYSAYEQFIERLQAFAGHENVAPKSIRGGTDLGDNSVMFELNYRTRLGGNKK